MNNIIIGNTFEVLKSIPDKSFDLVITDPPYDLDAPDKHMLQRHFLRIATGAVIVFAPPENQWIKPVDQYLFWVKPISTKNTSKSYSRFVEMIFVYQNGSVVWNSDRHWSQYTNVFTDLVDTGPNGHPYRKPPSLIRRLMLNHSNAGYTILDPFFGSGVVGSVAVQENRYFTGIEQNIDLIDPGLRVYVNNREVSQHQ